METSVWTWYYLRHKGVMHTRTLMQRYRVRRWW